MLAVMEPNEMLDPIFRHTIPKAPIRILALNVNFCRMNLSSTTTIFSLSFSTNALTIQEATTEITMVYTNVFALFLVT